MSIFEWRGWPFLTLFFQTHLLPDSVWLFVMGIVVNLSLLVIQCSWCCFCLTSLLQWKIAVRSPTASCILLNCSSILLVPVFILLIVLSLSELLRFSLTLTCFEHSLWRTMTICWEEKYSPDKSEETKRQLLLSVMYRCMFCVSHYDIWGKDETRETCWNNKWCKAAAMA